jgi:hypothetical protein
MKNDNDVVCNLYTDYYNITYDNKFGDAQKYGLREMPEPRNIYKDIVDDIPDEDSDNIVPDIVACAKVVLHGIFDENMTNTSEIEWKITHQEKEWSVSFAGDINKYGNIFVQLPYLENYDVEVTVWNTYNHCCKQYKKDAIIVKPYNIDIRGFYYDARPLPDGLKYDMLIPQEYLDNKEKEYRYYLWYKDEANSDIDIKTGIITYK